MPVRRLVPIVNVTGKWEAPLAGETFLPHGIAADPDGGVWISDVGSHEVVKFDDAGRRLITLGTRFEPGSGEAHFCKPADIAVSANDGAVYVADGYFYYYLRTPQQQCASPTAAYIYIY